jgi:hypothetical protein
MTKHRPTGKCKLCGQTRELCDSHYLPKRFYATARAPELANSNPVMSVRGQLKQISAQYRDYVFCEECEDRLNKHGEKWVLANTPKSYGGKFPLHDSLEPLKPILYGERINVYDVSGVSGFDMQKLVYFGTSIFWRAAVHDWKTSAGQEAPKVNLGPYKESMREFLLGITSFPKDLVLAIDIWPYKPVLPMLQPVVTEQNSVVQRLWFYVPGLLFSLFVGSDLPKDARESSATNGIVTVDLGVADSVLEYTKQGLKSQMMGPSMDDMFRKIAALRGVAPIWGE